MDRLRDCGAYDIVATARNADPDKGIESMNLLDTEAIGRLTKNVDVLVHMAAYLGPDRFEEKILPNNVLGTYNLFEGMRKNGVSRMVNGSTNHVIGFYRTTDVIDGDSPYRPDCLYGLGKAMAEMVGRLYSDQSGISVINIRIGHYSRTDRPVTPVKTKTWISHRDMLQLVRCAIDAPDSVRYLNVFGLSRNTGRFWPLDDAEKHLNYHPLDDGADYLEEASKSTIPWFKTPDGRRFADDNGYMGANFVEFTPDFKRPDFRRPQSP